MDDQFRAIFNLLKSHETSEVLARDSNAPGEEVLSMIKAFAAGKIAPKDRKQLIERLASNSHWIALLAREIKAQRPPNPRQSN